MHINVNTDLSEVRIAFSAGISLIIFVNSEVMSFIAQLDTKFKGQVEGLLGNMNGSPADDFQFPNGTILNTDSSLQKIHEYGLKWLVTESDSIFEYISPFDYSTYNFPDFVPTFVIPDPNSVSQNIRDLCGDSIECVFDAVTTKSLTFAEETLAVSTTFEIIQKTADGVVNCGDPGEVPNGLVSGPPYFVDDTVEITCHQGYVLEGTATLIQPDGSWSSNLPRCRFSGKGCKSWRNCGIQPTLAHSC